MSYKKSYLLGGDLEINRMGYGAVRIIGPEIYGMPDDPQNSIKVLQRAVELGVNFIDTADIYGPFVSEQLIAEALFPYNKELIIGTKGGMTRFGASREMRKHDATPQHLHDALNGSLNRLKIEQIDLYQLHRIHPDVPFEITLEFLQRAREEGRVKHVGLSEVSVEQIKKAQEYVEVASVQNRYNVFDREHQPVLDYCKENNIAFIPWYPIGGGEGETSISDKAIETTLGNIARKYDATVRQVALSWLLHHADNILLIPGTSNVHHLEQNIQAAKIKLTEEDMERLSTLTD